MTKKKENPAKRGRKAISDRVRRLLLLRWLSFLRSKTQVAPQLVAKDLADEFISANRAWLAAHRIWPGNHDTLKNILVRGRKSQSQVRGMRQQNWGLVSDLAGRRRLSTNTDHFRWAQMQALGIFPSVEWWIEERRPELKLHRPELK